MLDAAQAPRSYQGAIYHIINRDDRREKIFHDDEDRHRFLKTLAEVCDKTGWLSPNDKRQDVGDPNGLHTGLDQLRQFERAPAVV
jgi:hypothetical protein